MAELLSVPGEIAEFLLFWAFCGFLAYGLGKAFFRYLVRLNLNEGRTARYGYAEEKMVRGLAAYGPLGLATILYCNTSMAIFKRHPRVWGFCLRMPKELCEDD